MLCVKQIASVFSNTIVIGLIIIACNNKVYSQNLQVADSITPRSANFSDTNQDEINTVETTRQFLQDRQHLFISFTIKDIFHHYFIILENRLLRLYILKQNNG